MKNQKNNAKKSQVSQAVKNYLKNHYPVLILLFVGYLLVSAINLFDVATNQTIMALNINNLEVGQIADETIRAPRSIPADELNPVFIEEGEKIIRKGFPITEEAYSKLQKMAASPNYIDWRVFADSELFVLIVIIVWYFLYTLVSQEHRVRLRELIYQAVCFVLVTAAVTFGSKLPIFNSSFSVCIIVPAILFVLIHAILYGQLSATILSLMLSFGVFVASDWELVPFLFTLFSCLCATAIVRSIEHRIDMIIVSLMQAVFNMAIIILLAVIFNEPFKEIPFVIGFVALNGFLAGILALALITPIELILNTASVFRMMDLCDTNTPILKKLFITAAGTYQHSQMVGQLAENACREIGANALLAKVGAWYHDLGKMEQSGYFVENLAHGEENPHDSIAPTLSATILKSHVRKSVEIARQLYLPQQVIEIIEEHHGNSTMEFFYEKAKSMDPNTNQIDFMYPGNPPTSKESAVVMLADSCEAASRTLTNPTEERLEVFVQTIFDKKMKSGQLDDCDLTFSDLNKIKASFVKLLAAINHNRIKYPDQKDPDEIKKAEVEKAIKTDKLDKQEVASSEKTSAEKSSQEKKRSPKKEVVLGDKTLDGVKLNG